MSGGSYEYFFYKVRDLAERLEHVDRDPRRAAFRGLLFLIAEALHDIEWVDSGDYGKDGDHKAIDAVFAFLKADPETIRRARAYDELAKILRQFFEEPKP